MILYRKIDGQNYVLAETLHQAVHAAHEVGRMTLEAKTQMIAMLKKRLEIHESLCFAELYKKIEDTASGWFAASQERDRLKDQLAAAMEALKEIAGGTAAGGPPHCLAVVARKALAELEKTK